MGLILFLFEYQGLQKYLNTQVFIFAPLRGAPSEVSTNLQSVVGANYSILLGVVNRGLSLCCIFAQGVDKT